MAILILLENLAKEIFTSHLLLEQTLLVCPTLRQMR